MARYNRNEYAAGETIAAALGISRRTLYRWLDEGRMAWPRSAAELERYRETLHKRPRGPRRNPRSRRYTVGRHRYVPAD